jgi:hypothetical protein
MNQYERAAQIWSVLALAARNQKILSYGTIEKLTGLHRQQVGKNLDPIAAYCGKKKLPKMHMLVVNETKGLPGEKLGSVQAILSAQNQAFVFDWLSHGCPTPEEFEKAHKSGA